MPRTDLNRINREMAGGIFQPVYFFHGDEEYLTRQAVSTVIEKAVDKATADFNYERFYGADLDAERLLTAISTPPMMASHRVILVRGLEKASLKCREMLAEYARKPFSSTILVLAAGERIKIDSRKKSPKWAATLEEFAATVLFWPLNEAELIRWIVSKAESRGKKISSQSAYELYMRTGDDLGRLADDVEKLAVYCGEIPEIKIDHICQMTGIEKGGTIFDWVDTLASNNTVNSCYLAGYLASRGESAVGAVAVAGLHFTRIARIKQMLQDKKTPGEIRKILGLVHWREESVKELFNQARRYSMTQLDKILSLLLETDLSLKTSSLPDKLMLEMLSFRFKNEFAG